MLRATLEVTINDEKWPKLTMITQSSKPGQGPSNSVDHALYDGAYNVFEGILHNKLRPLVEELINQRQRK